MGQIFFKVVFVHAFFFFDNFTGHFSICKLVRAWFYLYLLALLFDSIVVAWTDGRLNIGRSHSDVALKRRRAGTWASLTRNLVDIKLLITKLHRCFRSCVWGQDFSFFNLGGCILQVVRLLMEGEVLLGIFVPLVFNLLNTWGQLRDILQLGFQHLETWDVWLINYKLLANGHLNIINLNLDNKWKQYFRFYNDIYMYIKCSLTKNIIIHFIL